MASANADKTKLFGVKFGGINNGIYYYKSQYGAAGTLKSSSSDSSPGIEVSSVSGTTGYRNGISVATSLEIVDADFGVMTIFRSSSPDGTFENGFFTGYFLAGAIYLRALNDAEVLAVSNAMIPAINLTTVPTSIYWGHKQDGTLQLDATYQAPA